jgi:hypothetical protein
MAAADGRASALRFSGPARTGRNHRRIAAPAPRRPKARREKPREKLFLHCRLSSFLTLTQAVGAHSSKAARPRKPQISAVAAMVRNTTPQTRHRMVARRRCRALWRHVGLPRSGSGPSSSPRVAARTRQGEAERVRHRGLRPARVDGAVFGAVAQRRCGWRHGSSGIGR